MLTTLGATTFGLASPGAGAIAPPSGGGGSLADYALVTSAVVLNASTAIRIAEPTP